MAKRKKIKIVESSPPTSSSFLSSNRVTLVLGAIVLFLFLFIAYTLFKGSVSVPGSPTEKISKLFGKKESQEKELSADKNYTVKEGDDLWKIAESTYGSGYNAYDIATKNKITDPNSIYAGQNLLLPEITPGAPTKGEISATHTSTVTSYTVKNGDSLWSIAQNLYDNPYNWSQIATANNLANPDLIYPGTVLSIPR